MPLPAAGEDLRAWKDRAHIWLRDHGRRAGRPKATGTAERWKIERLRARTVRAEKRLERELAAWHWCAQCRWLQHQRVHAARIMFRQLPTAVASRLGTETPRDPRAEIAQCTRDQLSALHIEFFRRIEANDESLHDFTSVEPDGEDPTMELREDDREPLPGKGADAAELARHWFGRYSRVAAKRAQLDALIEEGAVHDAHDCEDREASRVRTCIYRLYLVPDTAAARVQALSADVLRTVLEQEVERALAELTAADAARELEHGAAAE